MLTVGSGNLRVMHNLRRASSPRELPPEGLAAALEGEVGVEARGHSARVRRVAAVRAGLAQVRGPLRPAVLVERQAGLKVHLCLF